MPFKKLLFVCMGEFIKID